MKISNQHLSAIITGDDFFDKKILTFLKDNKELEFLIEIPLIINLVALTEEGDTETLKELDAAIMAAKKEIVRLNMFDEKEIILHGFATIETILFKKKESNLKSELLILSGFLFSFFYPIICWVDQEIERSKNKTNH